MNTNLLLSRLKKVKSIGHRKWKACCPAHDDHDPSMIITEIDDRILLYCYAGCGGADIVDSIGLSLKDLFADNPIRHHMYGGTPEHRPNKIKRKKDVESADLMLRLCAKARREGRKLSGSDLKAERDAWLLITEEQSK